jgi:hypothetical protein
MRSQEKEVEWNVLDGCFAGLGLLMLGRLGPGRAVPQLLRGVVVFDCANSSYRKHAKGSVSVGLRSRCVTICARTVGLICRFRPTTADRSLRVVQLVVARGGLAWRRRAHARRRAAAADMIV